MTLDNYIQDLQEFVSDIDKHIENVVVANSGNLLGTLKLRLFNKGLDGNLQSLGPYSEITKTIKTNKGQRASFVTLRDTGGFYRGMFIEYKNSTIIIDSSDSKTDLLTDIYGEAILKLTDAELNIFIDSFIEPYLNKIINKNGSIEL